MKNGHSHSRDRLTWEFKKPQLLRVYQIPAIFSASSLTGEANADNSQSQLNVEASHFVVILQHYENKTKAHDKNDDGLRDIPRDRQL